MNLNIIFALLAVGISVAGVQQRPAPCDRVLYKTARTPIQRCYAPASGQLLRIRTGWILGSYHALSYGSMMTLGNWVPSLLAEVWSQSTANQLFWGGVPSPCCLAGWVVWQGDLWF
jgi:hypothetical protein